MGDNMEASWVDLTKECSPIRCGMTASPSLGELPDYLAMLREAQGETSCRVSPMLTRQASICCDEEVASITRNNTNMELHLEVEWGSGGHEDWGSDPKSDWGSDLTELYQHKETRWRSDSREEEQDFSRGAMAGLLLSNLLSLLLGAGLGICLYRRAKTSDIDL